MDLDPFLPIHEVGGKDFCALRAINVFYACVLPHVPNMPGPC